VDLWWGGQTHGFLMGRMKRVPVVSTMEFTVRWLKDLQLGRVGFMTMIYIFFERV
jgi:hypothetical protein